MTSEAESLDHDGATSGSHARSSEPFVGRVVAGCYEVRRRIGGGGSSHVFEAVHVRLGKRFALKLLRPEISRGPRAAKRFRREAKAIARLQSEHIVSVVDCGELEDGTPFLVMELLEGEDLRSLLERCGPLPARRAVQLVREACSGLTVVHDAGLVHRDLKPENLFITRRDSGEDWCKVLDFGVAKMEASQATADGAIIGTVRYMAPEQLTDGAAASPAADVYALGAILFECLAGRPAIEGETLQEIMYRVIHVEPPGLSALRPELLPELSALVGSCLAKAPERRPSSTAELARALQAAIRATAPSDITLNDDNVLDRPSAAPARLDWGRVAGALALTGLLSAVSGWLARGEVPPRASAPAWPSGQRSERTSPVGGKRRAPAATAVRPATDTSVSALPAPLASVRDSSGAARARPTPRADSEPVAPRRSMPARTPPSSPFDDNNPYD